MYRPPFRVVPASRADLRSLASVYRRAFSPGVVTRYCWSSVSPSALDEWFIKRLTGVFEKREKGDKMQVLAGKRGDKVVAMAYYSIEAETDKMQKDEETRELPEGANEERTKDLFGQVEELVKGIEFARLAWHVLAVAPEAQGTGVGKKMMQAVLDAGKAAGLPVTLEATEGASRAQSPWLILTLCARRGSAYVPASRLQGLCGSHRREERRECQGATVSLLLLIGTG
ncbi:hypothetical protein BJY59DRAFT_41702 [Rhodotorula toruloides]